METVALTWTLLFISFLAFASTEEEVKAKPGETVTLPCKASNKTNIITVVEWSRPDLDPECVFLYRNEWIDADSQNSIFKNRVDLQDEQMKDGKVSVILKNVTINDTGTYECRVIQTNTKRRKRAVDHISIITLRVSPPGPGGGITEDGGKEDGVRGRPGLIAAISVILLLAVAVMSLIVFSKTQKKEESPLPAPPDKEAEQQLV